ncbi:ABC-three component system middle component 1 [Paraburkholderia tropica]|uniref:ABC-three component system middle component 1 n=1 Tax=Paraburkholderia tropica TaxID=92647 RepID=UPI002AB77A5E|nr:ABC-three component system middle component 1 [Paraburkholderia tropica]
MAEAPAFADLLLQAAERIGARVVDGAVELVGNRFNSEFLSEAVSSIKRHDNDLPKAVRVARIDDIPVLIGELSGTALRASIEPQLRRYRNQAIIARSWLAAEAPNLQLFLIGPQGAFSRSDWRQLASEIEADDRTCRKLVWLFDQAPTVDDAEAFLTRTFVARPWPTQQQQVLLDTVASYALPDGWEEAVDDKDLDFDGLVEALIELEAKI